MVKSRSLRMWWLLSLLLSLDPSLTIIALLHAGKDESSAAVRAVPDMKPASRLAGSAFRGLFSNAKSPAARPLATQQTSLAAVIHVQPANGPMGINDRTHPASDSLDNDSESHAHDSSNEHATMTKARPSGRMAGSALRALGPSGRQPGRAASQLASPPASAAASAAGPDSLQAQEFSQGSVAAARPDQQLPQKPPAGAVKPGGKLAGNALRALASGSSRCA